MICLKCLLLPDFDMVNNLIKIICKNQVCNFLKFYPWKWPGRYQTNSPWHHNRYQTALVLNLIAFVAKSCLYSVLFVTDLFVPMEFLKAFGLQIAASIPLFLFCFFLILLKEIRKALSRPFHSSLYISVQAMFWYVLFILIISILFVTGAVSNIVDLIAIVLEAIIRPMSKVWKNHLNRSNNTQRSVI